MAEELWTKFGLKSKIFSRNFTAITSGKPVDGQRSTHHPSQTKSRETKNCETSFATSHGTWRGLRRKPTSVAAHSSVTSFTKTKTLRPGLKSSVPHPSFLLMTATPQQRQAKRYQLFLRCSTPTAAYASFRDGRFIKSMPATLMRRMVKRRATGSTATPLFPERKADTSTKHAFRHAKPNCTESVTTYVKTEWAKPKGVGRPTKKGLCWGFAYVTQRSLASRPRSNLFQSLKRRARAFRKKLCVKKREPTRAAIASPKRSREVRGRRRLTAEEQENDSRRNSYDRAHASQTPKELQAEIIHPARLEGVAKACSVGGGLQVGSVIEDLANAPELKRTRLGRLRKLISSSPKHKRHAVLS